MKTPEKIEKDEVKKYLDSIGVFYFSAFMAGYGRRGIPDIIACFYSLFVGIEVKAEGKEPTPWQYRCMENIREAGGIAIWGTAETIIEELESLRVRAADR